MALDIPAEVVPSPGAVAGPGVVPSAGYDTLGTASLSRKRSREAMVHGTARVGCGAVFAVRKRLGRCDCKCWLLMLKPVADAGPCPALVWHNGATTINTFTEFYFTVSTHTFPVGAVPLPLAHPPPLPTHTNHISMRRARAALCCRP
jgi:hypothetical protein